MLLGIEKNAAHLYLGSQHSFKLIDSILLLDFFKKKDTVGDYKSLKKDRKNKEKETETSSWFSDWIAELTKGSKPKLFLAGDVPLTQSLQRNLNYKNLVKTPVFQSFYKARANGICQNIRKVLKEESRKNLEKVLLEFRFAQEDRRVRENIFQISKAVVQGKVRKLIITDELNIFGKIDYKSGGLSIHPMDLDHEDDCILDDLAQMVLNQGGEVVIAKRDEIPKGRPILAILDDEGESLAKIEDLQYEALQERFG